jgi:hypothetical protein
MSALLTGLFHIFPWEYGLTSPFLGVKGRLSELSLVRGRREPQEIERTDELWVPNNTED